MSKRDLPKWAFAHVQKCRQAFGIGYAGFEFVAGVHKTVGGNKAIAGQVWTHNRYERAVLHLKRGFDKGSDDPYEVLTHECLHAAAGAQRAAVDRILDLVPPKLRAHAEELWQEGNEATITRLARALTPVLRSMSDE